MDSEAWWTTVHGVTKVRHDLATQQSIYTGPLRRFEFAEIFVPLRLQSIQKRVTILIFCFTSKIY